MAFSDHFSSRIHRSLAPGFPTPFLNHLKGTGQNLCFKFTKPTVNSKYYFFVSLCSLSDTLVIVLRISRTFNFAKSVKKV